MVQRCFRISSQKLRLFWPEPKFVSKSRGPIIENTPGPDLTIHGYYIEGKKAKTEATSSSAC